MKTAKQSVECLDTVTSLQELARDAEAGGFRMLSRLIQDWNDETNRFDQPGEQLYAAVSGGQIVGVCGLNRDPFAGGETIGRVRRLYVASAFRRQGIASALLHRLINDARPHFNLLHLRTHDRVASAFYASLGFSEVAGNVECTQALTLTAPRDQIGKQKTATNQHE